MKDEQLLNGVRILDLSRILAGPWATQLLADFGAEVIKIERPNYGDETRKWGPPWNSDRDNKRSDAAYFYAANRNKQSLTCDISKPEGQAIIKELVSKSDVLVENFKSGTLNKYGLNIEELRKINSDIIYCSISAYGNKSSRKTEPGYDAMIQASAGLMSITGEKQGNPQKVGVAISDIMAGMYAATAILGSLFQRLKTGISQDINIPLYDSQVAWLANQNMNFLIGGKAPERMGNAHPNIAPYQSYNTKDGDIMIAIGSDEQFSKFIKLIECENLKIKNNFKRNHQRVDNIKELNDIISNKLIMKETSFWLELFKKNSIPCGPINNIEEVFNDDYAEEQQFVHFGDNKTHNSIPTVKNPVKFSNHETIYTQAAPVLGEHKHYILRNLLNYSDDEITSLESKNII